MWMLDRIVKAQAPLGNLNVRSEIQSRHLYLVASLHTPHSTFPRLFSNPSGVSLQCFGPSGLRPYERHSYCTGESSSNAACWIEERGIGRNETWAYCGGLTWVPFFCFHFVGSVLYDALYIPGPSFTSLYKSSYTRIIPGTCPTNRPSFIDSLCGFHLVLSCVGLDFMFYKRRLWCAEGEMLFNQDIYSSIQHEF